MNTLFFLHYNRLYLKLRSVQIHSCSTTFPLHIYPLIYLSAFVRLDLATDLDIVWAPSTIQSRPRIQTHSYRSKGKCTAIADIIVVLP